MKIQLKTPRILLIILTILLLLPSIQPGDFVLHIALMVLLYASLGQAWNILGGFCGQFSVGHAAFFGISGYTIIILLERFNIHPLLGILFGVIFAAFVAFAVGLVSLKLQGIYFSMVTVALVEMLRTLALYFRDITHGTLGAAIPLEYSLSKVQYYYLACLLTAFTFAVAALLRRSRFGTFMVAIRENEDRAKSLGIKIAKYKVMAAVISAVLTALGGAFYTLYTLMIEPASVFNFLISVKIIIVAVIGGVGTLVGPLLGALVSIVPDELIRSWLGGTYAGISGIVYGTILIIVVKAQPEGVIKLFTRKGKSDINIPTSKGGEARGIA